MLSKLKKLKFRKRSTNMVLFIGSNIFNIHGTVEWQVNTLVSDYKLQRIDNVTNITILVHQLNVND